MTREAEQPKLSRAGIADMTGDSLASPLEFASQFADAAFEQSDAPTRRWESQAMIEAMRRGIEDGTLRLRRPSSGGYIDDVDTTGAFWLLAYGISKDDFLKWATGRGFRVPEAFKVRSWLDRWNDTKGGHNRVAREALINELRSRYKTDTECAKAVGISLPTFNRSARSRREWDKRQRSAAN